MKKRQKRSLTLLEIMIVIVLIGLIGSVIGFNMKGSLDAGKAFKTTQAQEQILDILTLEVAKGYSPEEVVKEPAKALDRSGLIKGKGKAYIKDGWGQPFEIKLNDKGVIKVESAALKAYDAKKKAKSKQLFQEPEEDAEGDD